MPDIKHTQAKRLYDSLCAVAGTERADLLLDRLPLPKSPSEKQKAAWARASCEALADAFDEKTAEAIRKRCHCHPSPAQVTAIKRLWEESASAEDFAQKATAQARGAFEIEARGDAIILIYPRCYCAFIKHSTRQPPEAWCACSLGYAEAMFSAVASRPAAATLLKSVVRGDARCEIAVRWT